MDCYRHCQDLVRDYDNDRYLATLFCPPEARPHVFALLAFNAEIARTRETVSDPLPGEVRLQWWTDTISGRAHGEVASNPVAEALLETIAACDLPAEPLLALIEQRIFDLYDDPMPMEEALTAYCSATASALFELTARILAAKAPDPAPEIDGEVCEHAGQAYAMTGLLRALPVHAHRWQCFLPVDLLSRHGLAPSGLFDGKVSPALASALAEIRERIDGHRDAIRVRLAGIPQTLLPGLLPLSLLEPYLRRMAADSYDPFRTVVDLPAWRKIWILWRTARRAGR